MGCGTPRIHLAVAPTVSGAQLQELQLDPESADDRILGELLTFRSAHGADVRFVTADYGARIKAKGHGLICTVLTPELRLNDPDPRDQELRELRERLTRYEAARPTLKPFLAVGDLRDSFQKFRYQATPPSSDKIERAISRVFERHHHAPRQGDGIAWDAWSEYNREWDLYLQQARRYIGEYWTHKNRTFYLQFGAENTSDLSANDVRARFHLPDGFTVVDAEDYNAPRMSGPPKRPMTPNELLFQTLTNIGSLDLTPTFPSFATSLRPPRFSAPHIDKSSSYNITFSSAKIPQRDAVLWDPIVLKYDSAVEPRSFAIDCSITIGNGFGVSQEFLHVIFERREPA